MRKKIRETANPAPVADSAPDETLDLGPMNATADELRAAEAALVQIMIPPMPPPPPVNEAPPPPPPAVVDVPEAPDVWLTPIQTFSFDSTIKPGLATPATLFGFTDPDAGLQYCERRVGQMARWLQGQPNAPWGWIDGQTRLIGNVDARWRREMVGSKAETDAFEFWVKMLRTFETEVEERIRTYLSQSNAARGRAAALDEFKRAGGAPSAVAVAASINATPRFDPGSFVAQMVQRGVRVEIDKVTHRPASRGAAAGISLADHDAITRHRHEIAGFLATAARARSAS